MLAEQQRRSLGDQVQYLTDRQLEQLVEQTPGNDIKDYEDLQSGRPGVGTPGSISMGDGKAGRRWGETPVRVLYITSPPGLSAQQASRFT